MSLAFFAVPIYPCADTLYEQGDFECVDNFMSVCVHIHTSCSHGPPGIGFQRAVDSGAIVGRSTALYQSRRLWAQAFTTLCKP